MNITKIQQAYYSNYCDENEYGKFSFLIGHFITGIKNINQLQYDLISYLESLQNRSGKLNDQNSFSWGGTICFRYDHIVILDETVFQVGRYLPGLVNDEGKNLLNEDGEWVESNLLGYVNCGEKAFLIAVNKKLIRRAKK